MSNVRERIVNAALELLETSGVTKFAQPQVAREAGVPQGHLAYYFPKRTDLLKAVAARIIEAACEDVPRIVAENVDAAMDKQVLAFLGTQVKNRKRTRALLALVVGSEEDAGLRAQLADSVNTLRDITARVLRKDSEDPDVDIAIATVWGLAIMHLLLEGRRPDSVTDAVLARLQELRSAPQSVRRERAATPAKPAGASARRGRRRDSMA